MKRTIFAALATVAIGTASAATYKMDEHHANARFIIDHFDTNTNVGGLYGLTGSVDFDQARRTGKIDIAVPVANLQSGSQYFTDHLESTDIFDVAKYPSIRFASTKFSFDDKKLLLIDSNLTMRDRTAPVKLKAERFNYYQSPMTKTEIYGGDFSAIIDHTRWSMDYLVDAGMTKTVHIDIQIEAAKQQRCV